MSSTDTVTTLDAGNQSSLVTKLHIVYALHSVGLALGAFGAASVSCGAAGNSGAVSRCAARH